MYVNTEPYIYARTYAHTHTHTYKWCGDKAHAVVWICKCSHGHWINAEDKYIAIAIVNPQYIYPCAQIRKLSKKVKCCLSLHYVVVPLSCSSKRQDVVFILWVSQTANWKRKVKEEEKKTVDFWFLILFRCDLNLDRRCAAIAIRAR